MPPAQVGDHPPRRLAPREPLLRFPPQVRPRVGPGKRARLRQPRRPLQVGAQRVAPGGREAPRRLPHRREAHHQIAPRPPQQEPVRPVRRAEPHAHAEAQPHRRPLPRPRTHADRARRRTPQTPRLVEGLRPHGPHRSPRPRTKPPEPAPAPHRERAVVRGSSPRGAHGVAFPMPERCCVVESLLPVRGCQVTSALMSIGAGRRGVPATAATPTPSQGPGAAEGSAQASRRVREGVSLRADGRGPKRS